MPPPINMVDAGGDVHAVAPDDVAYFEGKGWSVEGAVAGAGRVGASAEDAAYSGIGDKVDAYATGVARGATAGVSDIAISMIGGDSTRRLVRKQREANPVTSLVGEGVGGIAAAGTGVGPVGKVAAAGKRLEAAGEGAGALSRIGRSAVANAGEGALAGAGSTVSELALSEEPIDVERAVSSLSSNMLYGAAIGGGAGTVGKSAEVGLLKGKAALDAASKRLTTATGLSDEVASMDAKGLAAAEKVERESLKAAADEVRARDGSALADEITAYNREVKEAKHFIPLEGVSLPAEGGKYSAAELRAIGRGAQRKLDVVARNPTALAQDPQLALKALQEQENALTQYIRRADDIRAAVDDKAAKAAADEVPTYKGIGGLPEFDDIGEHPNPLKRHAIEKTLPAKTLSGRVRGMVGPRESQIPEMGPFGEGHAKMDAARVAIKEGQTDPVRLAALPNGEYEVLDGRHRLLAAIEADAPIRVSVQREVAQTHGNLGTIGAINASRRDQVLASLEPALNRNRELQAKIATLAEKAELTSARLDELTKAKELLRGGAEDTPAASALGALGGAAATVVSAPLGAMAPLIGVKAADMIRSKVMGRLGKAMKDGTARAAAALSKVFGATAKGVKLAVPTSTRVLAKLAFAPDGGEERQAPTTGRALPDLYRKRSSELREQVAMGPDGAPMVRPAARQRIADALAPLAHAQPLLADRMETLAVRRMEFLASKLPRRPEVGGIPMGPDNWQPSDMQMRTWARFAAAAEDPTGVLERVADGIVSPEDAEVMREVYPEMLAEFTTQLVAKLPELRQTLPYNRRIALSVLTGVPVDASMEPRIIKTLQAQYTPPAPPKAQFGSVKGGGDISQTGTASERREQRM